MTRRRGNSYIKSRRTVEHTWDCSSCHVANKGRHLVCVNCGKPKDGEAYDETRGTTVTDAAVKLEAQRGVNWQCSYCHYDNRGDENPCGKCGAPREDTNARVQGTHSTEVNSVQSTRSTADDPFIKKYPVFSAPQPQVLDLPEPPVAGNRTAFLVVVAVAGLCLLVAFCVWAFMPWRETVHVSATLWSRTTNLQQRVTRNGEGWGVPSESFNSRCESRQHGTHNCNPYDCNPHSVPCNCHEVSAGESCSEHCSSSGNGFSECEEVCTPEYVEQCDSCTEYDTCYEQCPTYDDWCSYQYYEWPIIRTESTHGTDLATLAWPALDVDPNPSNPQRLDRQETYTVVFRNDHGTWEIQTTLVDFRRYHTDDTWVIEVNHAGNARPISQAVSSQISAH